MSCRTAITIATICQPRLLRALWLLSSAASSSSFCSLPLHRSLRLLGLLASPFPTLLCFLFSLLSLPVSALSTVFPRLRFALPCLICPILSPWFGGGGLCNSQTLLCACVCTYVTTGMYVCVVVFACVCLPFFLVCLCVYGTCVCVRVGRQLTIFNSQTTVRVGGGERSAGMFQGQLSGLYYNGLRILNMAAEGHPHIRVEGSARLVGDMPSSSITPQSSAAAGGNRSDSAPSISDITTTTATNRKQGATQHTQVSSLADCVEKTIKPFNSWHTVYKPWTVCPINFTFYLREGLAHTQHTNQGLKD